MQRRIKVGQMLNLRDLGGYETEDGRKQYGENCFAVTFQQG